jgi:flagellar basal-body rod protein FlgG
MLDALYTAASGMLAQQTALDGIANNLANVNTVGFKAGRTAFEDLLYNNLAPQQASKQGNQMGLGTMVSAIQVQMDEGAAQANMGLTDVMITGGPGFFRVQRPDGTIGYTRAGNFAPDAAGQLVTTDGGLVLGVNGKPITFPPGSSMSTVKIGEGGVVSVEVGGTPTTIGTISLATFTNPAGLEPVGSNLFVETLNSGKAVVSAPGDAKTGTGTVRQSTLEMSNVKAVDEMVSMITTQRAYEAVAKVVQASDEMLGTANGLRR